VNLVFLPWWSARLITAIGLMLLLLAGFRWWREGRGGSLVLLRAVAVVLLILAMANPQSMAPRERKEKPRLVFLLDTSASMSTKDVANASRFSTALQVLTNPVNLAALNQEFLLDTRTFARDAHIEEFSQLAPDAANGDASDIGGSIMSVASELGNMKAQAGIVLVSDGRATAPGVLEAGQLALARSVPLWTWTVGGSIPRHDVWVETVSAEALAFSGAEVELAATVHEVGYDNRSFKIEILRGDTLVETQEVVPGTNGTGRVSIKVKAPDAGEQRYLFRVAPQPEEADAANNERAVFLRSVGERVRVLLAEGQPHWDTKFLVQSLKRNLNVELTAVYRLNAARHVAVVSAFGNEDRLETDLFPRTADHMNSYDVIILGRGAEAFFDGQTEGLLSDFVFRGGNLICARGKPYGGRFQPLAKLEPVAWSSGTVPAVKIRPTDAGRDNPIFDLGSAGTLDELLERVPALDQVGVTLGEKPLAIVLASAANQEGPVLLAYQRYGQGKVLSLNASGLWRWSFRESGQEESEIAYGRFWISLLQWLLSGSQFLPGADVALTSSRRYYSSEQPMQFVVSTRNLSPTVFKPRLEISGPDKKTQIEPRPRGEAFFAEAGPFPPGTYRVTLHSNIGKPAELVQDIEVVSASIEPKELSADPEAMRKLAEISHGAVLSPQDVARMPEIVRRWEAARLISHRQQPLWDRWWWLTGLLALLGGEWWLRRREGLL
jgi:hypothetical protein